MKMMSRARQIRLAAISPNAAGPACRAALLFIARGCLADLRRHIRLAARDDAGSLHGARIALTRLRTAIRFFLPALNKNDWKGLQEGARWLNGVAGKARDLDVALARRKGAPHRSVKRWRTEREHRYEDLRAALGSARCRRFLDDLARQTARAPSPSRSVDEARLLKEFSVSRLACWRRKLVKDRDRLKRMSSRKRHRLRMRAKRFKYALGWSQTLLKVDREKMRKQIEQAKVVQNALGKLNDAATHRALASRLKLASLPRMVDQGRSGSRHRLLRLAKDALKTLERLDPT